MLQESCGGPVVLPKPICVALTSRRATKFKAMLVVTRVGALSEDTLETLCLPEPSKHNVSYLCSPKTQLQRLLEQLLPFYSVVDRMLKIHLIIGHHLQDIHYLQKDDFLWI
jgi:hypothetical protein